VRLGRLWLEALGGGGKALACHQMRFLVDKLDLMVYNPDSILKNELVKGTPGNYIAEARKTTGSR